MSKDQSVFMPATIEGEGFDGPVEAIYFELVYKEDPRFNCTGLSIVSDPGSNWNEYTCWERIKKLAEVARAEPSFGAWQKYSSLEECPGYKTEEVNLFSEFA